MGTTSAFGEGDASHYKKHHMAVKSLGITETVYIGDKVSGNGEINWGDRGKEEERGLLEGGPPELVSPSPVVASCVYW